MRWQSSDYGLVQENPGVSHVSAIPGTSNAPTDLDAWYGFSIQADDVQVINLRQEFLVGLGFGWLRAHGGLLYGCIVHSSGWIAPDREHGPGLYSSNPDASKTKHIENMVFLNTFRYALQLAHNSEAILGYQVKRVVVGGVSTFVGSSYVDDLTVDELLMLHFPPNFGFYNEYYTDDLPNGSMEMINSIVDSANALFDQQFRIEDFTTVSVHDNLFTTEAHYLKTLPGGSYDVDENTVVSSGHYSRFWLNEYAPGFATLTVFDFDEHGTVQVDISALAVSGTVRVHNPMVWEEVEDLTVTGGMITLPMTGWTTPTPEGLDAPYPTPVIFSARSGVFIVEKL